MKNGLIACVVLAVACTICSCSPSTQLYSWGKRGKTGFNTCSSYEACVYEFYKTRTPESAVRLAETYEYMIAHPGGVRKVVPPGICAEYGFFLMQNETLDALCAEDAKKKVVSSRAGYYQRGLELLEMEIRLYPESAVLIEPILKQTQR